MSTSIDCIIYKSRRKSDFEEAELKALLLRSRIRNAAARLSGILIFDGTHFLKLLEGPKDSLAKTFECIGADDRHTDLTILSKRTAKLAGCKLSKTTAPARVVGRDAMTAAQHQRACRRGHQQVSQLPRCRLSADTRLFI